MCLVGQQEDAAGVGDFGILAGGVGSFCRIEGLPGFRELLLFEVEVGVGYVDFREASFAVAFGKGQGLLIAIAGLGIVAAAALEMAEVEEGGNAGIRVFFRSGEGLVVAEDGKVIAAIGDELNAEIEPGRSEAGAEGYGAAIGNDGFAMLAQLAMGEGLSKVKFGEVGGEFCGALEAGESGCEIVLQGEGVGEAVVSRGQFRIAHERAAKCRLGLRNLVEGHQHIAVIGPREGRARAGSEGGLRHVEGRLELIALAGDETQAEQGGLGARIGLQCPAIGFGGVEEIVPGVVLAGCFQRGRQCGSGHPCW